MRSRTSVARLGRRPAKGCGAGIRGTSAAQEARGAVSGSASARWWRRHRRALVTIHATGRSIWLTRWLTCAIWSRDAPGQARITGKRSRGRCVDSAGPKIWRRWRVPWLISRLARWLISCLVRWLIRWWGNLQTWSRASIGAKAVRAVLSVVPIGAAPRERAIRRRTDRGQDSRDIGYGPRRLGDRKRNSIQSTAPEDGAPHVHANPQWRRRWASPGRNTLRPPRA